MGELVLELGESLPLPNVFRNPTDFTVTFNIIDNSPNIFNLPSPIVDPRHGTIVLPPHTNRDITDLALPLPASTPTGSDTVVLDVFASARVTPDVSRIWGPFKCTYSLTVTPRAKDLIQVPVRWCAVEGSPQASGVTGPTANGGRFQTAHGKELLRLLQKLNDQVFFPQSDTHIFFRHASAPQGIPVIDDPDGPTGRCARCKFPGVFDPDPWEKFFGNAIFQCRQAWNALYPGQPGTILINPSALAFEDGAAPALKFEAYRAQLCNHPAVLPVDALLGIQALATFDPANDGSSGDIRLSGLVSTLAHELGHTLTIDHGDGLDNNMDGTQPGTTGRRLYDGCDPLGNTNDFPVEDRGSTARSIMSYSNSLVVTPLQKDTLRAIAKLVPGARYADVNDPAGSLVAQPKACEPRCGVPADVVLSEAGFAITPGLAVTSMWHTVRELVPATATNQYLAFVDLDNDSATGCDPSTLFPDQTGFSGAELVSRVTVSTTEGQTRGTPAVWRCEGGRLAQISDSAIRAWVLPATVEDVRRDRGSPPPLAVTISVSVPDALRGPVGNQVRLQAVATRTSGAADRLPASGRGGVISLIPPQLPECTMAGSLHAPGSRATVRAAGLTPGRRAEVLVGDQVVATSTTSATGDIAVDFVLPATSRHGLRPVAVLLDGGAETATCSILVHGNPVTPGTVAEIEPQPAGAGWNRTDVTVKLTATDIPAGPGIRDISYGATGAQPIPSTRIAGNRATISLSTEGQTTLSFFATNNGGVAEAPQAVTVRIDKTVPVIAYTGNAGSYRITATVDIGCTATDALSGILRTTCRDITAPAFSFQAGTNTFEANAVDFAFNAATATTSFTIDATYSDLCQLTTQFRSGSDLGNSLCAILRQAERDQAAGRADRKAERLQAYIDRVRANVPRIFSTEDAETLVRFASSCATGSC